MLQHARIDGEWRQQRTTEPPRPGILDDPHDRMPRPGIVAEQQPPADRVAVLEMPAGEAPAHDGHPRRVPPVRVGDAASGQQVDAERLERVRAHDLVRRGHRVPRNEDAARRTQSAVGRHHAQGAEADRGAVTGEAHRIVRGAGSQRFEQRGIARGAHGGIGRGHAAAVDLPAGRLRPTLAPGIDGMPCHQRARGQRHEREPELHGGHQQAHRVRGRLGEPLARGEHRCHHRTGEHRDRRDGGGHQRRHGIDCRREASGPGAGGQPCQHQSREAARDQRTGRDRAAFEQRRQRQRAPRRAHRAAERDLGDPLRGASGEEEHDPQGTDRERGTGGAGKRPEEEPERLRLEGRRRPGEHPGRIDHGAARAAEDEPGLERSAADPRQQRHRQRRRECRRSHHDEQHRGAPVGAEPPRRGGARHRDGLDHAVHIIATRSAAPSATRSS